METAEASTLPILSFENIIWKGSGSHFDGKAANEDDLPLDRFISFGPAIRARGREFGARRQA